MVGENLRFKTFKVRINSNIEYVSILDKIFNGKDRYLVEVVGERANLYTDGKSYVYELNGNKREIITPNKGKIYIIDPSDIISIS